MTEQRLDFAELERAARRLPRYSETYWRCPSCQLGPTGLISLSDIWWALCSYCATGAALGADYFDVPPEVDEDLKDNYELLFSFVAEHDISDAQHGDLQVSGIRQLPTRTTGAIMATLYPGLTNARLREAAELSAREAAERAKTQASTREVTAAERAEWQATLVAEMHIPGAPERRSGLRDWYQERADYDFMINGERLTGADCASRLRAGGPYSDFFRAQGSGIWRRQR